MPSASSSVHDLLSAHSFDLDYPLRARQCANLNMIIVLDVLFFLVSCNINNLEHSIPMQLSLQHTPWRKHGHPVTVSLIQYERERLEYSRESLCEGAV